MDSKFRNGAGKPVVALDIDGTLGDYHAHFLWFASHWLGVPLPDSKTINPGLPLHKFMGIPKRVYRECKLAYRQGGLKRWMPVYEGAGELTRAIRNQGAEVWITTTRPYLRLDNIDPDTRHWLERNKIEYDAVLFGEDKYSELTRQVEANRVVAVVDDLKEQISEAHKVGVQKVYLRDQPYNKDPLYLDDYPVTLRVFGLWELQKHLIQDIRLWKEKNEQQRPRGIDEQLAKARGILPEQIS